MINPLKVATGGYLKRTTKAVLIIAVAGYLNFGGTPPPIPPDTQGGGGYGTAANYARDIEDEQRELLESIREEEIEVLSFIETFMRCL